MRLKADQAALEADKLIRIRREQGAIDQLRRDIKTQLDALSQAALAAYRAGEIVHPQLISICQRIDAVNEQIGQREARIEQIRAEKLASPPPAQTGVPCPSCRQPIPEGAAFCPVCGHKIPKAPPTEVACATCGGPLLPAAQFCPNCGARRVQAPQTIRCTGCGAELPATAIFCPDCGTRASAAAPATPPATPTPIPAAVAPAIAAPTLPAELVPVEEPAVMLEPEAVFFPAEPMEVAIPAAPEAAPIPLTKLCPSCRAELPLEAIFCPDCGTRQA
jgi:RNA polymerase subunit RPABC4/transcription elongation factor Spt4